MNNSKAFRICKNCKNVITFKIINSMVVEVKAYCKTCKTNKTPYETIPYTNGEY